MIYEASFTGLLKIILIIIVVFYVIKFLSKLFAPMLVNYAAKKMEEKVNEHFNNQPEFNQPKKKEEPKKPSKQVGEYIDYEEID